jgi:membrane-associated phospholipid phosphatase
MTHLIIILLLLLLSTPVRADLVRKTGDYLQIAIPAFALGRTFGNDDREGFSQMSTGLLTNLALTQVLKETTNQLRPDHSDRLSFPSGHTAAAFQGAAFVHKRYGLEYAWPHYVGAVVVAYSRVHSDRHHTRDVIGGALLGTAVSWAMTTSRSQPSYSVNFSPEFRGLILTRTF